MAGGTLQPASLLPSSVSAKARNLFQRKVLPCECKLLRRELGWTARIAPVAFSHGGPGGRGGQAALVQGQHEWLALQVQQDHGPLDELYPQRRFESGRLGFIAGGGTIPWMGLVNRRLFDINEPSWGGWSGRFTREKVADFWSRHGDIRPDEERFASFYTHREAGDVWTDPQDGEVYEGDYVPVWRFRDAIHANFRARMDWCVRPREEANHHPVAAADGDCSDSIVRLSATPGRELGFDASGSSDPNGGLSFKWWICQEAGTYPGRVVQH